MRGQWRTLPVSICTKGEPERRIKAYAAALQPKAGNAQISRAGTPGMKKSIAWPTVCWLYCATPSSGGAALSLVTGAR